MIDPKEIRIIDINAASLGTPTGELMENAGTALANYLSQSLDILGRDILVIAGPGNNGGDGMVAARHLSSDNAVTVLLTCHPDDIRTIISQDNYKRLPAHVNTYTIDDLADLPELLSQHDVIIDAMLGIGLTGELRHPYSDITRQLNALRDEKILISADIPTGHGTHDALHPHHTVTFHDSTTGMTAESCGTLIIAKIGVPQEAETHVGPGDLNILYPRRAADSHKGDNGRLLIIGGGPYNGAPLLAGLASLRTGTDLTRIATPQRTYEAIRSYTPDLLIYDLPSKTDLSASDLPAIAPLLDKSDAMLIGPGLGLDLETQDTVQTLIKAAIKKGLPVIVDADGIQALSTLLKDQPTLGERGSLTVTPHHREFFLLTGVEARGDIEEQGRIAQQQATRLHVTILLKGPVDILTDGTSVKYNTTHTPAMTKGGSGDVLAGITASLISQHVHSFDAIRVSAYLNGSAGNKAAEEKGCGLSATDIIEWIPYVVTENMSNT